MNTSQKVHKGKESEGEIAQQEDQFEKREKGIHEKNKMEKGCDRVACH